jgi:hypothetical protein
MDYLACGRVGVNNEWSYAKTVQVLAHSGHIVFNGWVAAIVGWMLYLGALFVKLFGFSFTTVRLSMLPVSMATLYLTHRTNRLCDLFGDTGAEPKKLACSLHWQLRHGLGNSLK